MSYHPERERLAAMFACEWLRKFDLSGMDRGESVTPIALGAVDLGLQMADHLLTKMAEIPSPGDKPQMPGGHADGFSVDHPTDAA